MPMKLNVGDIITLKKPHPCNKNAKEFEIMRVGMDFRIRCLGCGHEAWIPRQKLERMIRSVKPISPQEEA